MPFIHTVSQNLLVNLHLNEHYNLIRIVFQSLECESSEVSLLEWFIFRLSQMITLVVGRVDRNLLRSSIHGLMVFRPQHFTFLAKDSWLSFTASMPAVLEFVILWSTFFICLLYHSGIGLLQHGQRPISNLESFILNRDAAIWRCTRLARPEFSTTGTGCHRRAEQSAT